MKVFTRVEGIAAPMFEPNIDTDRLIPHRFLRKPLSAGYRNFLFHDERFTQEGGERPDFVLNREPYRRANVLVAGPNFGCGSTREGAVYALDDFGIRAVIAPSFGDIFRANCLQNGLLPVVLPQDVVAALAARIEANPGITVAIDLASQTATLPDGAVHRFDIAPGAKEQMLRGLDEIGITLEHAAAIEAFEQDYRRRVPWLFDK